MKRRPFIFIGLLVLTAGGLLAAGNNPFVLRFLNGSSVLGTATNYADLKCSTGMNCSYAGSQFTMTASGAAGTVTTGATNVYTSGLQDFSGVTMELPEGAGFVTTADSTVGFDSTTQILHLWGPGAADSQVPHASSNTTTATFAMFATSTAGLYAPRAIATTDLPLALANQTSINGLNISSTTGTLTMAASKTLTVSNTLTLAGTDGSTLNVGAGGTLAAGAFAALPLSIANGGTGAATAAAGTFFGNATSSTAAPAFVTLSGENAQTSTYQVLASDFSGYKTILVASGTFTITLVASGSQPAAGQYIKIINYGNGSLTVSRSGQNINGATNSVTVGAANSGQTALFAYVESDGTNYFMSNSTQNSGLLVGKNWAAPAAIGTTTPAASTFTTTTSGTAGTTTGFTDLGAGFLAAAMTAQSSATCTNVTGMTWNIAANKNYILRCEIPMTLAASATIQYCIGGPGTATSYSLMAEGDLGTAGIWSQISTLAQTSYGTKTNASASVAASSVQHVWAAIQNGATASGTALTLQTAANGTNNITVLANASCTLTQVN